MTVNARRAINGQELFVRMRHELTQGKWHALRPEAIAGEVKPNGEGRRHARRNRNALCGRLHTVGGCQGAEDPSWHRVRIVHIEKQRLDSDAHARVRVCRSAVSIQPANDGA